MTRRRRGDIVRVLALVLGVVGLVLVATAAAGAAVGLFFGVLMWTLERVAGSVSGPTNSGALWFTLVVLTLALIGDWTWRLRRR